MQAPAVVCILLLVLSVVYSVPIHFSDASHFVSSLDMEDPPANATYGELAQFYTVPAFVLMNSTMFQLNSTTLPTDVKYLRNLILQVRDLLDVFIFSFPIPDDTKQHDIFLELRGDLNDGYTWIGNFKNLADMNVNYTNQQLVDLRNICLQWQKTYFEHASKFKYYEYLQNPSTTEFYVRSIAKISQYYWGIYAGLAPSANQTGYENVALLLDSLTTEVQHRYNMFTNLTDIYDTETQLVYHGYRKLVRSINAVSTISQNIFSTNSTCVKGAIATNTKFFSTLGKIEDNIAAYDFYVQNNNVTQAVAQASVVENMWINEQKQMATASPMIPMACLLQSLISF